MNENTPEHPGAHKDCAICQSALNQARMDRIKFGIGYVLVRHDSHYDYITPWQVTEVDKDGGPTITLSERIAERR